MELHEDEERDELGRNLASLHDQENQAIKESLQANLKPSQEQISAEFEEESTYMDAVWGDENASIQREMELRNKSRDLSGLIKVDKFTVEIADAVDLIRTIFNNSEVTQREIAKRSGLARPTVSSKLGGTRSFNLNDIGLFLNAMGYDVSFYVQKRDTSCPCAFTTNGCTCQTFDASNGGVRDDSI